MANKNFWLGLLITVLIFGTAIIGCDTGTNPGSGGGSSGIAYTVSANGKEGTATSTQLTFSFEKAVSGLKVEDIKIFGYGLYLGSAEKNPTARGGALTGTDTEWTLKIKNVRAGKIRVEIDKDGIEGGRKTVPIYEDTSTGEDPDKAITLTEALWTEGGVEKPDPTWYKFTAEAGAQYRIQWKDRTGILGETDRVLISITPYKSDKTTTTGEYDRNMYGITMGLLISGESGDVYLKVENHDDYAMGTFAIRFIDMANTGPKDNITVQWADATLDFSVEVWWQALPMSSSSTAIESKGYKVYRSDTENGSYKEIGDVPATPGASDFTSYTDEGLEAGKTYWYAVAGYNSKGEEGEMSEPKESTVIQDVDAESTPLTLGTETNGEFKKSTQVDWYKFEAASGKTYEVEWETDSPYMVLQTSAFKSDKTPLASYYDGGSISGVSGTVYLKVTVSSYFYQMNGYLGPYTIKVTQQ
jgi:hypothetical protein